MEALDAYDEIARSIEEDDIKMLEETFHRIGDEYLEKGYEVSSISIIPLSPKFVGKAGTFYVWSPETGDTKLFYFFRSNIEKPEPYEWECSTRDEAEKMKQNFLTLCKLEYFHGEDEGYRLFVEEMAKKESVEKEIEESAKSFQVFGGK